MKILQNQASALDPKSAFIDIVLNKGDAIVLKKVLRARNAALSKIFRPWDNGWTEYNVMKYLIEKIPNGNDPVFETHGGEPQVILTFSRPYVDLMGYLVREAKTELSEKDRKTADIIANAIGTVCTEEEVCQKLGEILNIKNKKAKRSEKIAK